MSHWSDKTLKRFRPHSRILGLLDRFCDKVYGWLKNGVFGYVFTRYPGTENTLLGRAAESSFRKNVLSPARRRTASEMENSLIAGLYRRFISWLLCVKLRVYGVFLFSFLIYSALAAAVGFFRFSRGEFTSVIIPACLSAAAVPLLVSTKTLSQALGDAVLGKFAVEFSGNSLTELDRERVCGRSNAAFLLGLVLGVLSYFVSPLYMLLGLAGLIGAALVFNSPEFGTVMLFFLMPLFPTGPLIILAAFSIFSFLVKVILGKRVFRVEAVDIALIPFIVTLITGTLFGVSPRSLLSGSMSVLFTMVFYLVVYALTTRMWLRRAVIAFTASAAMISFYGLIQYVTTKVAGAEEWVDQEMFAYITGRAVATLENPNMLAVYLIIALPVACSALITAARGLRERTLALICVAAIGSCLLFTWTRGAWLGALFAAVLFIMIWSRKSVYLFICGVLALPFLPYIVPANIWARFTSIGNTADSSTAYRISILKSVFKLLPDYIFYGLGCGEDSWYQIYPKIALTGVEWTAHSHNLYIQIWIQTGLISLITFLIFAVFLFVGNFNLYRRLSDASDSIVSHISIAPLKDGEPLEPEVGHEEPCAEEQKKADKIRTVNRLEAAAPLCGVFAVLIMGLTDYVWYNYRVYLIFWLACGLTSAYVRVSRRELDKYSAGSLCENESESCADIRLERKNRKERSKSDGKA